MDVRELMRRAFCYLPLLVAGVDKAEVFLAIVIKSKRPFFRGRILVRGRVVDGHVIFLRG